METVGYWCDSCRRKYVRHVCKNGLPCAHRKEDALYVYAKSWGRGGERVRIADWDIRIGVEDKSKCDAGYFPGGTKLWITPAYLTVPARDGTREQEFDSLAQLLLAMPTSHVEAFFRRWESYKSCEDWVHLIRDREPVLAEKAQGC